MEGIMLLERGDTPGYDRTVASRMLQRLSYIPKVKVSAPINREAPPLTVGIFEWTGRDLNP